MKEYGSGVKEDGGGYEGVLGRGFLNFKVLSKVRLAPPVINLKSLNT